MGEEEKTEFLVWYERQKKELFDNRHSPKTSLPSV